MRKLVAAAAAVVLLHGAAAAQVGVGFNINVGGPPIMVAQPPQFLFPPELGFGVAVGVPYDMFYWGGGYYIFRGGGWFRTPFLGGPWMAVPPSRLPLAFRRHNMARIHSFRDREFRQFRRDRMHYRGRTFRPEVGRRGAPREMRGGPGGPRGERRR